MVYDGYRWSDNVNDGTKDKVIYTNPDALDKTDAFAGLNKNQTPTGYYVRKYYDAKHEHHMQSSINIITMRYADVLLMDAPSHTPRTPLRVGFGGLAMVRHQAMAHRQGVS